MNKNNKNTNSDPKTQIKKLKSKNWKLPNAPYKSQMVKQNNLMLGHFGQSELIYSFSYKIYEHIYKNKYIFLFLKVKNILTTTSLIFDRTNSTFHPSINGVRQLFNGVKSVTPAWVLWLHDPSLRVGPGAQILGTVLLVG